MLLRRLERIHTVIERRNSAIARFTSRCETAKKILQQASNDLSLIVPSQPNSQHNQVTTANLDLEAQTILDLSAQRVECAKTLVELLNEAEEEIMKEIILTESSLSEVKKLNTNPINREPPSQPQMTTEEHFCVCRGLNVGEMVSCDNPTCPFQWFHIECVGLKSVPSETWFCPYCTALMRRTDVYGNIKREKR